MKGTTKRLLALILGGLGLRAYLRRGRPQPATPAGPSPAEDLRAKLAEARAAVDEQVEPAGPAGPTVDERRADVHAEARRKLDELRDSGEQG